MGDGSSLVGGSKVVDQVPLFGTFFRRMRDFSFRRKDLVVKARICWIWVRVWVRLGLIDAFYLRHVEPLKIRSVIMKESVEPLLSYSTLCSTMSCVLFLFVFFHFNL